MGELRLMKDFTITKENFEEGILEDHKLASIVSASHDKVQVILASEILRMRGEMASIEGKVSA